MKKIWFVGNDLFSEYNTATIEECVAYCKTKQVIGLDIETGRKYQKGKYNEEIYVPGLNPHVSRIVMIQIGDLENQYVIDARVIDIQPLKEILENNNILKVGHNLKFEGNFFLSIGIKLVNVWDTFICEKVLYNGLQISYSLASLMKRYLGIEPVEQLDLFSTTEEDVEEDEILDELDLLEYKPEKIYVDKSTRLQFVNIGDLPFTIKQIEYGADDIIAPLKIYEIQKQGRYIQDENKKDILYLPTNGFYLQNKFTQVLASIEYEGMEFDSLQWLTLSDKSYKIYLQKLEKLNTYVETNYQKDFCNAVDLFTSKPSCAIQWSSSTQVIKFFRYLGFCPREKSKQTGKDEWTVGAKALFKLLSPDYREMFYKSKETEIKTQEDLILNYLLLKKAEQASTTFGKDFLKYVHPITGKIHSSYNQYMHTGRLSSTNPNLQNIPNGEEYRHCFYSKDYIWVNADYSSQESRILADVSNNTTLIDFFNNGHEIFGEDMHSFAATNMQRVIKKDPNILVTKKSDPKARQTAKALNFALSYGGSAHSLKDTLSCSLEEAEAFIQAYFDGFPGLEDDFNKTKELACKRGWIELDPHTKQKYFFPYMEEMESLQREAWACYPDNYKELSHQEKIDVKAEVNFKNPQLKQLWSKYFYLKGKLERRSLNYRIQGNAATMSKIAGCLIHNYYDGNRFIINLVHDEIIGKTISKDEEFLNIVKESMIKAGTYTCKRVKMDAEAELANYWKH